MFYLHFDDEEFRQNSHFIKWLFFFHLSLEIQSESSECSANFFLCRTESAFFSSLKIAPYNLHPGDSRWKGTRLVDLFRSQLIP